MLMIRAALAAALLILAVPASAGMELSCFKGIDANKALETFVEKAGPPILSMEIDNGDGTTIPAAILAKPNGEWRFVAMVHGSGCIGIGGEGMKPATSEFQFPAEVEN